MEHRLIDRSRENDIQTLKDMKVLEKEQMMNLIFVMVKLKSDEWLAGFKVEEEEAVMGMRANIDGERNSRSLMNVTRIVNTIPCSSAQCERDFSLMNVICTDRRTSLQVENISKLTSVRTYEWTSLVDGTL